MNKEEKLRAFEILENLDSFWDNSKEEIFNAIKVLTEYVDYLENRLASTEAVHEYDVKMIDEVKGENIKLNKIIDEMAKAWKQDDHRDIEEIKQYFEKKVEEIK